MSGFELVAEGPLSTARLQLHHIHTRPLGVSSGRVLLLGGSNFDVSLKRQFLSTSLVEQFEVVTYEPRGIGRTKGLNPPWTMSDYAQDALACLDAIGWDHAHIVGESFGGMTALQVALRAPQRVDRMVIASAAAGGACGSSFDISKFLELTRPEAAAAAMALQDTRWIDIKESEPDHYAQALAVREQFEEAFAPSLETGGYAALLDARRDHDVCRALGQITTPTLVCAGLRDRQAPPEVQERLALGLVGGKYAAFDAGHGLLFSHGKAMEEAIKHLREGGRR
ncbi:MAG: alpha/beta fold hydrolase [Pseudomonadota bacterium]